LEVAEYSGVAQPAHAKCPSPAVKRGTV